MYHDGDAYANAYSAARISYYGISGFPTAKFDGVETVVGGSSSSSMYSSYLPKVNARNAIPCNYTVGIYGENTSGLNYSMVLDLDQVAGTPVSNLVAHLVITESGFPVSWGMVTVANYVCRMMVPNANGTSISFSSNTAIDLSLSFTLDPTWNVNELELVAFIQNNTSKEVLQGAKVALTALQPFHATAYFSSSDSTVCESNTVQFYDNSLGNIVSWNWTFEGGNPSTSTLENPVVTYDSHGVYDVQLIVSDGAYIDTLDQTNYLTVRSIPAQANTPAGPAGTCEGMSFEYTTDPVPYATNYTWMVTPSDAGNMTGNGTTGTFNAYTGWLGDYTITVRAENECGDGTFSSGFAGTLNHTPYTYQISQGGGYCEGDPGIELKLFDSEVGIDYEIYIDNDPTGIIMTGTGDTLDFGYQTDEGIYTIVGFTDVCSNEMIGNAWIHMLEDPGQAATPSGPVQACNNEESAYSTTGANNATTYNWYLNPAEAGTLAPNGKNVTVTWNESWSGTASLTVEGENNCGIGQLSNAYNVDVFETPDPQVSGLTLVCNDEVADYSTPDNSGSTYDWVVEGGDITAGAGTHSITVEWGDPGTGYITVTEENSDGCSTVSETYIVTIDDCTGLEELLAGSVRIYPNPATGFINVSMNFQADTEITIIMMNQLGQVVLEATEKAVAGNQVMKYDISSYPEGIYTLRLSDNKGESVQQKFVKVR